MLQLNNYFCFAMKRLSITPDPVLMVIAILCLTAFQLYWLSENYGREKNALQIKSEALFRESVMQLQVNKLNSHQAMQAGKDSSHRNIQITMNTTGLNPGDAAVSGEAMITSINIVRNLNDTFNKVLDSNRAGSMLVNKYFISSDKDSLQFNHTMLPGPGGDRKRIFKLLSDVQSIQDSLRISEIDTAFKKVLLQEQLDIPYTIIKSWKPGKPSLGEVVIGFDKPVSYKLALGNTVPFLLKRILLPVIFSILLLGITIAAFVVMYKSLQRQKKQAEEKNEFISNITHELKTPIATAGVAIEALKNFNAIDDLARTAEYLDISKNELSRLDLLVDKVLTLSKFESHELALKFERVDMAMLAEEVVASLKLPLQKLDAVVTLHKHGDTCVMGDKINLLSVLFNLVDNAIKYSNKKPVIKIDVNEIDNKVNILVADNGIGIAPAYREKVFEKFFRVPHGDTHNAKGYGLGLSFVAQVIQKHNGKISMESSPGNGTTVKISLPKINVQNV